MRRVAMWCAAIVALVILVMMWPRRRDGEPPARAGAAETRGVHETGDERASAQRGAPGSARGSESRGAGATPATADEHEHEHEHEHPRSREPQRPIVPVQDRP